MKRLITVTLLALATLILTPTAFAGKNDPPPVYNPVYMIGFSAWNKTPHPIQVDVECDKGNFWAYADPGQKFGYGLDYAPPEGGFPPDWFAGEGEVIVKINGKILAIEPVECLANLSMIEISVTGKKKPKAEVTLTE